MGAGLTYANYSLAFNVVVCSNVNNHVHYNYDNLICILHGGDRITLFFN